MKKSDGFNNNRRLFVGGGVVAAAALLYTAAVGRGALKACGVKQVDVDQADLQALIRIGNAYLGEMVKSGEISTLYQELLDDRHIRSAGIASSVQDRLVVVDRQAQEEFQRGETVSCDGWVLAKSEARLCAMIAISARRSKAT